MIQCARNQELFFRTKIRIDYQNIPNIILFIYYLSYLQEDDAYPNITNEPLDLRGTLQV